ncbi:MAG TPA: transposase, partial [Thermodesulfobacteriota bacterium]|nr:transposase [Thermodesulfobacteriota bacterium]
AGVVNHPSLWQYGGYNEIQEPRKKNMLINYERLQELLGFENYDQLQHAHKGWIEDYLNAGKQTREDEWTESIAAGSKSFIERVKEILGGRAIGRDVQEGEVGYQLRESAASYKPLFRPEKVDIGPKNAYLWDISRD